MGTVAAVAGHQCSCDRVGGPHKSWCGAAVVLVCERRDVTVGGAGGGVYVDTCADCTFYGMTASGGQNGLDLYNVTTSKITQVGAATTCCPLLSIPVAATRAVRCEWEQRLGRASARGIKQFRVQVLGERQHEAELR